MNITADIFADYLKCPTKCFLRAHGETGSGNEYADWVRTESEAYRVEQVKRMTMAISPGDCVAGVYGTENLKTVKWRVALDFPARAQNMESRVHAVERTQPEGRERAAQFIAIRFTFTNKLSKDDKLLVAYDALVLSEMSGWAVSLGKIIHGDNHSTLKVKTASLTNCVGKLAVKIAVLLSEDNAPDLVLNRHCEECEFQSRCRQKAIEKDDLSLLSGMAEKERKKLNSEGIFTVTQLSYTFRPRRRSRRHRNKPEKHHHSLRALAIRENKIHLVGNPALNIEGTPVYLDVEGIPDRDFYYLIGARIGDGVAAVQHSLWAEKGEDEKRIWEAFLAILDGVENPVLLHYGRFETTFLKRMLDRYGGPPEHSSAAKALKAPGNLLAVIFVQVYFPTYTNRLKEIAGSIGFKWSDAKVSGVQSLAWRSVWERSRDPAVKQVLVQYNAHDCEALALVTDALVEITRPRGRPGIDSPTADDVVSVDSMKPQWPFSFGNKTSSIQEIEFLRKAAYWSYQRDRVHFRDSNQRSRKPKKPIAGCRTTSMRINKVVVNEVSPECPTCKRLSTVPKSTRVRILYDLRFSHFSIKRWVVKYVFQTYLCWRCQLTFGLDKRFRTKIKFGWNVVAYFVYQIIELAIPQRIAVQSMNRLFGLSLNCPTANTFKSRAAEFYRETYQQILGRIAAGNLVHADETIANVKGKGGYVWVFTNLREVAYVYSESREAELLHTTLAAFKGVLVSDFYTAYDSLDCPQQRCLTHLLRDLNDEILKHPFDEELKQLVIAFAGLVKPMVETVDRYGLKRHFLRKHRSLVKRFYRSLAKTIYQSEAALKCKDRFEKNRNRLFTFLDYDGVPWNNNNAEHAIKAYAALRDVTQGKSTRPGSEEYLILLSICETCEYQGLDFLEFLRSGEKDIEVFAKSKRRRRAGGKGGAAHAPDPQ